MANELIFINTNLTNYQALIEDLPEDVRWVLLDSTQGGIEQILDAVSDYSDLDSIQIFSHGSSGTLQLGSTVLSSRNIEFYNNKLNQIGQHLTKDGDILLYGCSVAEGEKGEYFTNRLASVTQADIAASTDITGGGSNWLLEYTTGFIEVYPAYSIASTLSSSHYNEQLAFFNGSSGDDTIIGSNGDDMIYASTGNDDIEGGLGNDPTQH